MVRAFADGAIIYAPNLSGYELEELKVTNSVEKAGTAEFTMPLGHPAYNAFTSFKTIVTITRHGRLIFRGRPLPAEDNFYCSRKITCEGERCFLRDAVMRAYSYKDKAVADIFKAAINAYNSQVEKEKQFRIGEITVAETAEEFKQEQAGQVSDTIDALVSTYGGHIVFTSDDGGVRVINWLASLNGRSGQTIEFGENLLDYSSSGANTDLATAILPYGAKSESTGKYVTIESVNNGKDYLQDDEAVALRGFILKPFYWDDIKSAKALLTRTKQQLAISKMTVTTLELTAVDLSAMDKDIDSFDAGDWVRARSAPHGLDDDFLLRERSYDLLDPSHDKIVLGAELVTLTGSDVAGDRNSRAQLQQAQRSIATDYSKAIADAGVGSGGGGTAFTPDSTLSLNENNVLGVNVAAIMQAAYPVGALYLSTSATSPATLFGFGTWERIEDTFLPAVYVWKRTA